MGCFDGAEVCQLVDSYILHQLSQLFEHHSDRLYRNDGLAIMKGLSGLETERVKKKIIKVFKDCRLKTIFNPYQGGMVILPSTSCWFSLNDSEKVKALTLAFCSIQ